MAYAATQDMLLGSSSNITTVSCLVNDRIMLVRPNYKGVDFSSANSNQYRFGFRILFPEIGRFVDDSGDTEKSFVTYLHEQSGQQIIEYMTIELGTFTFYVVITGIPLHDHASIEMGGPAYATYFTETNQSPEE